MTVDPKRMIRDGYDIIGSAYRPWADAGGIETRAWFMQQALAHIPASCDVLELGCGPGVDAVAFADGRRYTGVDISGIMLSLAQEQVSDGTFLEHDLTTLDFREESFDAIVSLFVFGHVPTAEQRSTIERVFRWLRPGGVFCASFPLSPGDDTEDDFIGVPMFFGGLGREATEQALVEAGFGLEMAEVRVDQKAVQEGFLWVIARKPA